MTQVCLETATGPQRLIRWPEVAARVGFSAMHIWRLEKAGRFPRRVNIGPNSVAWVEHEVDTWVADRIAQSRQPAEATVSPRRRRGRAA